MMLAEGRPLVDNVFSLYEGVLRLELDRPTYERCGLQGNPIEDGGKKHQKARWGMTCTHFPNRRIMIDEDIQWSNLISAPPACSTAKSSSAVSSGPARTF
jgi:hypothetical protein